MCRWIGQAEAEAIADDDFLANEDVEDVIDLFIRKGERAKLFQGMKSAVSKEFFHVLGDDLDFGLAQSVGKATAAIVTSSTGGGLFFAEIMEEQAAAADVVAKSVVLHGLDASFVVGLALFIDGRGEDQFVALRASAQPSNRGCAPGRDVADDAGTAKADECFEKSGIVEAALAGKVFLVDESVVGEDAGIEAQESTDDRFLVGRFVGVAIEFVAADEEGEARSIFHLILIEKIAHLGEEAQSALSLNHGQMIVMAEILQVEVVAAALAVAQRHNVVVAELLIDLADELLGRVVLADAS